MDFLFKLWPWYIAGPVIGMIVPALLILGNKHFGISANLRHVCAACFPSGIPFFRYDWKKEIWNLFFVAGIFVGAFLTSQLLSNNEPLLIHPDLSAELAGYSITTRNSFVPEQLMSFEALFTLPGLITMIGGGLLVGFGSRYAGGCTSGHSIMGLSSLQWPSLIATCCFMTGGFIMANLILPRILTL